MWRRERETVLAKDHESGLELGSPEVAHKAIGVFRLEAALRRMISV